jgi:hypothetical protein
MALDLDWGEGLLALFYLVVLFLSVDQLGSLSLLK